MGELIAGDLRGFLQLLREESEPEPMAERLLEMYRKWCRQNGISPSCEKTSGSPENPP